MTGTRVEPNEIGWMFVPQYYTFVNQEPSRLHCFYTKQSTLIHGTEGEECPPRYGQQEIHNRIMSLGYQDCKVYVSNVDSQSSADGGIIVQVLGEMSNKGQRWRKFAQTFFLAEQPNGYFVLNDIFRFLKEDLEDHVDNDDVITSVNLGPSAQGTSSPTPSPQAIAETQPFAAMPTQSHNRLPSYVPAVPSQQTYGYSDATSPVHPIIPTPAATVSTAHNSVPQFLETAAAMVEHPNSVVNGYYQNGTAVSERSMSPALPAHDEAQAISPQPLARDQVAHPDSQLAPEINNAPDSNEQAVTSSQSVGEDPETVAEQTATSSAMSESQIDPSSSSLQADSTADSSAEVRASANSSLLQPGASTAAALTSSARSRQENGQPEGSVRSNAASVAGSSTGVPSSKSWASLAASSKSATNARGVASFATQPNSSPASQPQQPSIIQHTPLATSSRELDVPPVTGIQAERSGPGGKPFRDVCNPNRTVSYTLAQVTTGNCFLKNILDGIDETDVRATLQKRFGPIRELDLLPSKGCGFLEFASQESARRAVQQSLPTNMGGQGFVRLNKTQWPIVIEPKIKKLPSSNSSNSATGPRDNTPIKDAAGFTNVTSGRSDNSRRTQGGSNSSANYTSHSNTGSGSAGQKTDDSSRKVSGGGTGNASVSTSTKPKNGSQPSSRSIPTSNGR